MTGVVLVKLSGDELGRRARRSSGMWVDAE